MAKPLDQQQIAAFKSFLESLRGEYFTVDMVKSAIPGDFEFHASNYDPPTTSDFYELFRSVPGWTIEQEGYDSFIATRQVPGPQQIADAMDDIA